MSYARGEDRYEIEQLLYRYSWMADERKWELMDTVFGPGGKEKDITSLAGSPPWRLESPASSSVGSSCTAVRSSASTPFASVAMYSNSIAAVPPSSKD